jgi:hypothetical protein
MADMTMYHLLTLSFMMILAALALTAYEFRRMTDSQRLRRAPSSRRAPE